MIDFKPKGRVSIDFDEWGFGTVSIDPFTKAMRRMMGEVISESFVQFPPDLWCRPKRKDPLHIELCLPAFGEYGSCPVFTASVRGLVLGACQNVDDDTDPDEAAKLPRISSALRKLADEVDRRHQRWVKEHPGLVPGGEGMK